MPSKRTGILTDEERKALLSEAARGGSPSAKIQAIRMIEAIETRERRADPEGAAPGEDEPVGGFDELDELEPRRGRKAKG